MNIEDRLKDLIIAKYGGIYPFAKAINIPNTTITTILKRGIHKAGIDNIIAICDALNISVDEIVQDRIVPATKSAVKPLPTDLELLMNYIKNNPQEITLDGIALSDSETNILLATVKSVIDIIKRTRQ